VKTVNKYHHDSLPVCNKCQITGSKFEVVHSRSTSLGLEIDCKSA